MLSCRQALHPLYEGNALSSASNAGLLLARYLQLQKGEIGAEEKREKLLEAASDAVTNALELYKFAFNRREKEMSKNDAKSAVFKAEGRLIAGLGGGSVLEVGLTLNHTYGTPIIPGSSLKGLAAHYCSTVWGESESKFKGPKRNNNGNITTSAGDYYNFIFGSNEDAGFMTFHDAWIEPESLKECLAKDVMTPHHGDYYMEKKTQDGSNAAPSDFDDPIPVTFLSIRGNFEIHVSLDDGDDREKASEWETLTLKLLTEALKNWGIGGKTSSGYGIMQRVGVPQAAPVAAPEVKLFSPGQKVDVLCVGLNPKKNNKPQLEVQVNGVKYRATWQGPELIMKKGDTIQAIVESFDRNANPPLVLKP
ncbi:hypothetical protein FACS1894167_05090 [Synergistales bacterium]|nr:hypothetical protein FACS1894167_05090 [Synergistales bacterium]